MAIRLRFFNILILILLLLGCKTELNDEQKHISSAYNQDYYDLSTSKKVFETISSMQETKEVYVIHNDDQVLITFTTDSFDRLRLSKIRKKVKTAAQQDLIGYEITVSTDQKLLIESKKLFAELDKQKLPIDALNKRVDQLVSLEKEQT